MDEMMKLIQTVAKMMEHPQVRQNQSLLAMWNSIQRQQKPSEGQIKRILKLIDLYVGEATDPRHLRQISRMDPLSHGEIPVGFCPQTRVQIYSHLKTLFRNMLIIGVPNSGKTTWLRYMLDIFTRMHIPFLVFQKKINQFEHLDSSFLLPVTFFRLHQIRDSFFENQIGDDFDWAMEKPINLIHDLFERQDSRYLTFKALRILKDKFHSKNMNPNIQDFIEVLETLPERTRDAKVFASIHRIFKWLWEKNDVFHAQKSMYETMKRSGTVIQYQMGEEHLVWLLAFLTADRLILENDPLPLEKKQPFFIIIDDAQELLENKRSTRLPPFVNYLNMTRENQVGVFLSFQTITGVEPQALTSVGNFVFGRTHNHEEAKILTRILGLKPEYSVWLTQLLPGQFFLKTPNSNGVVQLQGPFVDANIPDDRNAWVIENNQKQQRYHFIPWTPKTEQKTEPKPALSPLARKFIWEVVNHPYWYASELLKQLDVSSNTFSKVQKQLCDLDFVRTHGIGKNRYFEITEKGYAVIEMDIPKHKGGAEHYFAVQRMLYSLKPYEFDCRTEDQLPGSSHSIDIIARRADLTLAIEYETGESTIQQNALQCAKTTANHIYIVRATERSQKITFNQLKNHLNLKQEIETNRLRIVSLHAFEEQIRFL